MSEEIIASFKSHSSITDDWDQLSLSSTLRAHLERKIIEPILNGRSVKECSFILFGPPGTGKTTIPSAIAKKLKWDVYEITPKIFVKDGNVETAITQCFESLKKSLDDALTINQNEIMKKKLSETPYSKLVFVFDEIDELVVTRDDNVDRNTRFATTLMLPLFNDLRKYAEKSGALIFVMTNHIERFDPAIKRTGRFDFIIPIGPPDRKARFIAFEKSLEKLRREYSSFNIDIRYLPIMLEGVLTKRIDFSILASASRRLGFGEIEKICRDVVEQKILMLPYKLEEMRKFSSSKRISLSLFTADFIDWIIKYRNISSDTQAEIERFYRDYSVYARGASPYLDVDNIQDKVHQEFTSLHIKHNIHTLKQWKINDENYLYSVLRNLAEINPFKGTFDVKISGCGINKEKSVPCHVVAGGGPSEYLFLQLKPIHKGLIKIKFSVKGKFTVSGVGEALRRKQANLIGTLEENYEIKIE